MPQTCFSIVDAKMWLQKQAIILSAAIVYLSFTKNVVQGEFHVLLFYSVYFGGLFVNSI